MSRRNAELRALERRYDGPIPRAILDAAMMTITPERRAAREAVRFYRRRAAQAVLASRHWRVTAARGGYDHQMPAQSLARRSVLAREMVHTARQYLRWRDYLHRLDSAASPHAPK